MTVTPRSHLWENRRLAGLPVRSGPPGRRGSGRRPRACGRGRGGRGPRSPAASCTWWDWASRAVLSWRLSNTMDVSFCVAALEEALLRFGKPQIFNTDQAASSPAWPSPARLNGPASKSRWMAVAAGWTTSSSSGCGAASSTRIFISRAMPTVASCTRGLPIAFYNNRRPHQALRHRTPMAVWRNGATARAVGMWATQERCPHAHSPNNSSRQTSLQRDIRRSERRDFQLRTRPDRGQGRVRIALHASRCMPTETTQGRRPRCGLDRRAIACMLIASR